MSEPKFTVIEGGATGQKKAQPKPVLTVIEGGLSPEERRNKLEEEIRERKERQKSRWLSFFSKKEASDTYSSFESRPPKHDLLESKDGDLSYIDRHATICAYSALTQLEFERRQGKTPNGTETYKDEDYVTISWMEGEYEGDDILAEYNGVIKRKDLARILKEGLAMPLDKRHQLAIQVADFGPRCVWYPFLHRFEYVRPNDFGGTEDEVSQRPDDMVIAQDEPPLMRLYKNIRKGGRVIKSEYMMPYTHSTYLIHDVEKIMKGNKLGKHDEEYYSKLLEPWQEKSHAEEKNEGVSEMKQAA